MTNSARVMSFSKSLEFALSLAENPNSPLFLACVRSLDDWDQLAAVLHEHVIEGQESSLALFITALERCSESTFVAGCKEWTATLLHTLVQSSKTQFQSAACRALCVVLRRVSSTSALRDFAVHSLPHVISFLARLTQAPPDLQSAALSAISEVVMYYPGHVGQYKGALKAWAAAGVFSQHVNLAKESARCLVLLQSTEQWTALVLEALICVERTLLELFGSIAGRLSPPSPLPSQPLLPLPSTPDLEPERSSSLLLTLTAICRILCYAGRIATKGFVQFPVVRWLSVVGLGLSIQPQQLITESTEGMLLCAVLPSIHTVMWNLVETIIVSCEDHLFPFTAIIDNWLMCSLVLQRSTHFPCTQLKLALHKTLGCWVSVCKDCDERVVAAVVQWLIEDATSASYDIKLSSIKCLQNVVQFVGPLLPSSTAQCLLKRVVELLSSNSDDDESITNELLEVLLDCILSGASSLSPPLLTVSCILDLHSSRLPFTATCKRVISACSMLQHPSVPPSHSIPSLSSSYHPSVPPSHSIPSLSSSYHPSVPPSHCIPSLSSSYHNTSPFNNQLSLSACKRSSIEAHHMSPNHTTAAPHTVEGIPLFAACNTPAVGPTQEGILTACNILAVGPTQEGVFAACNTPAVEQADSAPSHDVAGHLMDMHCEFAATSSSFDKCESVGDNDTELLGAFVDEPPDN